MFRQLAQWFQQQPGVGSDPVSLQTAAMRVFEQHPAALARFLEEAWRARERTADNPALAYPDNMLKFEVRSYLDNQVAQASGDFYQLPLAGAPAPIDPPHLANAAVPATWDQLIYAFMIENTRVFEIVGEVLSQCLGGERLAIPSSEGQQWLRATEELFFRDAPHFAITSVTSIIRPDPRAMRRNAYYRMFGMDLNHGTNHNRPYPYQKPQAANREFVATFEELLREVWRGVENAANTSGPNTTDDESIANLARVLRDMLTARRGGQRGNLSREEFTAVATMSWLHLTLQFDSPIIVDLKAEATSPEERLRKVGERVGLPAHSRSYDYFWLAPAISRILTRIEQKEFSTASTARLLYFTPPGVTDLARDDMMTIINHWSTATGRDMKARKVTASPRGPIPASAPNTLGNGQATTVAPSVPR